MKEWSSQYNPFNSIKVLTYPEHLKACISGKYLPPITVAIDPANGCNLDCVWCNAHDVRGIDMMTTAHMIELARFLKKWGVVSTCIAGGGEPLLNPGFCGLLNECFDQGLKNSVITNGTLMDKETAGEIVKACTWCGVSVDAGSGRSYATLKGTRVEEYVKALYGVRLLARAKVSLKSECRIGYKYLIHPDNQAEIYEAAVTAKDIGANDFQLRPVGWTNLTKTKGKGDLVFDHAVIDEQILKAMELEDDNFKVFGVRYKFTDSFKKKISFDKCRAIPLHPTFSADGNVYTCFDMRGRKDNILCRHGEKVDEILGIWGTEKHKEIIDKINPENCPRCTFVGYNEIIEKVFINDGMNKDFV